MEKDIRHAGKGCRPRAHLCCCFDDVTHTLAHHVLGRAHLHRLQERRTKEQSAEDEGGGQVDHKNAEEMDQRDSGSQQRRREACAGRGQGSAAAQPSLHASMMYRPCRTAACGVDACPCGSHQVVRRAAVMADKADAGAARGDVGCAACPLHACAHQGPMSPHGSSPDATCACLPEVFWQVSIAARAYPVACAVVGSPGPCC